MSVTRHSGGLGSLASAYYTGLSTDAKPMPSNGRGTFFELDTGNEYVLVDDEWWLFRRIGPGTADHPSKDKATGTTDAMILAEILSELRKITLALSVVVESRLDDPLLQRNGDIY